MKDLQSFINEEDKKKSEAKPVKPGEGADDKKFILMVEAYKRMRRTDQEGAKQLFEKAMRLKKTGDVSKRAVLAAAYI